MLGTQGALGRKSAVSPIRVIGTRDGPVREIRREVSPMQVRGRVSTMPQTLGATGAREPAGGGVVVQPRAGYPLEATRPSGAESNAAHTPPWIEAHTSTH